MVGTSDWSFARVWDGIATAAPERTAVVCGPVARTYGELADRSSRLASHLHGLGVGPASKVAIDLVNRPEYLETFWAALRLGAAPVNVNYRYGAQEIAYLLDDSDAAVVVTEAAYAPEVLDARSRLEPRADRSAPAVVETGDEYETAIDAADPDGPWRDRTPNGDDLILLYTGGTTGMPKGVMWRNDDLYVALWQMSRPGSEPPDPFAAVTAGKRAGTCLPACPLMHGTGLFIALSTLAGGGTVVLVDRPGLDAARLWSEVERSSVQVLTIVGDAFARPLLAALDSAPHRWDLSSLRAITSSGVTWSPETKRGLLAHLPTVTLLDSFGSSEGLASRSAARASDTEIKPARFAVSDRVKVIAPDGREVGPGSGEVGMVAVGGRLPLGYYKDPEKSARTFREVDGARYAIAGDYATVDADGSVRLLGRGSATVNTGGEKVYPEEVELTLREHPAVIDCVVVGVPDARFGEAVVALVQVAEGAGADEDELRSFCRRRGLAGYKVPRRVLVIDSLQRAPNGKADYRLLRGIATDRLAAAATT